MKKANIGISPERVVFLERTMEHLTNDVNELKNKKSNSAENDSLLNDIEWAINSVIRMIVSTNNGATAESGARALDILIPLRYSVIEKTRPVCETEREESLYEPVAKPDFGAMPNSAAQTKQSFTSNVPIENPKTTRC